MRISLETKMSRPDWDKYFMDMCDFVSTRGTCDRKQVGAVIVRNKRLLTTGYNGSLPGLPHCSDPVEDGGGHDMEDNHCVTGDTVVSKFQTGHYNTGHRTIKEIYEMWQDPIKRSAVQKMKVRSVNSHGAIVPSKILDVWMSDNKGKIFEITTSLGRKIKATSDHCFLTKTNKDSTEVNWKYWQPLRNFAVDDYIALNGQLLYQDKSWIKNQYIANGKTQQEIAQLANCSRSTIRRQLNKFNIPTRDFQLGGWNKGSTRQASHSYKGGNVKPHVARSRARRYALNDACDVCGSKDQLQVHHIDGNFYNDSQANLRTLCVGCHNLAHTPHAKRELILFDKIISIKACPPELVFDITIDLYHNFIGNGIVTHNCVRTVHAEVNAIAQAARMGVCTEGATLYCNTRPCWSCFKTVVSAGIVEIVYRDEYGVRSKDRITIALENLPDVIFRKI